ncbi:GYF domain [Musa troglodytarum]|uniref:GYF domain n=1 Tax=Musa troglodytarum TaxID=320322 RepID=A0A9E7FRZ2_9LILI|nr:GYF domain [Musa troglodytarum]
MANLSNADSRRGLTVEAPPNQNPKDIQGSDNPIPLSPQWLISKAVDSKELGPHQDNRLDGVKTSGSGDDLTNTGKKKYVFRPILHDSDSGRRDNWHDEERETNSAIRRDRWREGDKEPGDARKMERWSENTSKHFSDARRAPSERWNDSGNKESDQRRESKWNTRWGPDDKESDSWREKWSDSSKGGNGTSEKGSPVPYLISHGKDINNHGKETEGDDHSSRSWRSNYLLGRGRGDSSHQLQMPVKQPNMFGYSRVRTENGISSMPTSRGRFNPIMSSPNSDAPRIQHLGLSHDKPDGASGGLSTLRYTRMKLLDIYRTTDVQSLRLSIGDFIEVPSLTQVEPLEPLAFFAPTPDESVIIKGIDKGEIVSSGAPQLSKESSAGKINPDTVLSRQSKLGSRHDLLTSGDGCKDDNVDNTKSENCGPLESPSYEKQYYQLGQFSKVDTNSNSSLFQPNEVNAKELESAAKMITKEATWLESSSRYVVPRRSQSAGDHIHGSAHDKKDFSLGVAPVELDMRSFHLQKDVESKNNVAVAPLFFRDGSQWQNTEGIGFHLDTKGDLSTKRQSTESVKEGDPFSSKDMLIARNLQPPSPEDLSLYYKDPQGQIQGPFSGGDLIGWFEAGYFGIDLQVRHASSPADAVFLPLGDVMPHLRMKAGPPPGFGVVKHSVSFDESHKGKIVSSNSIHAGLGEANIFKTGQRTMHDAATEAQNRFLESLMSGNMNGSPSDNFSVSGGIQESGGSSSSRLPSVVGESGNDMNYLLAQAKLLERQRLSLNRLSHWSGGDASSMASKTNMISDSSVAHAKLLPSAGDSSSQILQSPQHVDLLSLLHAGADKPPSRSANSAVSSHSNFANAPTVNNPIHGGVEYPSDVVSMHYNQHMPNQIRLGVQRQVLQSANQPPLPQLFMSHGDLSSCLVPPDKMLSSEINQDPRLSSLLQQQYLLSQLQLHSQTPAAQLPLLEKFMLLQQQQKQEQQQHILSKVLSGHQSHQQFGDPSYGQAPAVMPAHNSAMDHLVLQRTHEALKVNQQMPLACELTGQLSYQPNLNLQGTLDVSSVSSGPLHLPHQIIDQTAEASDAQVSLENDGSVDPATVTKPVMADSSTFSETMEKFVSLTFTEAMEKPEEVIFDTQKISQSLGDVGAVHNPPLMSQDQVLAQIGSDALNDLQPVEGSQTSHDCVSSISDQLHDTNISSVDLTDGCHTELTSNKEEVAEVQEVKKASEKKSKKQKKSKTKISSDPGKIVSGQKSSTGIGIVGPVADVSKSEVRTHTDESLCGPSFGTGGEVSFASSTEPSESQRSHISSSVNLLTCESLSGGEAESGAVGTLTSNPKATLSQWAWKSTPGLKPKSLLEIQQEEQLRAQRETSHSEIVTTATSARILSVPWAGLVTNLESKSSHDTIQAATSTLLVNSENTLKSKNSKSQLHDLLAEEVLAKSNKEDIEPFANNAEDSLLQSPSIPEAHVDTSTINDDNFVEAKDTRKARKKASKSKASGVKIPQSVVSSELSAAPSPIEKAKSTRQAQQDKDYLPAPPTGPSLGDFVLWKGDQATSVPPPAWSGDSRKPQRPIALRDIQMEQEKRSGILQQQVPIPTPVKQQPSQISHGSGTSRQLFGSSPSNTVSSIQLISQVPAQKSRDEDDLFWGPLEQTKPNPKSPGSWGIKGTTSKGASGAGSGQKPSGSRPVNQSLSSFSSPSPSVSKGRGVSVTKNSEATEFRDWCVNEWIRLTGTNDTSFLEFCIKQSTSEAEMLLRENLGSMDPNHEFIDKFLNYKEFLPSDVLEIAFQLQKSHNPSTESVSHRNSNTATATEADGAEEGLDGPSKGRAKKKGKKGQKVSASILGFNVVSNRIMMGEIQSIQD